ncbi:MAG TPA: reverse transcriptase domain-containing protein [Burkholderiaceae bacterium]|nr:reverse transcriptase domain-containing protein [Burkholderiaceae bacterium]
MKDLFGYPEGRRIANLSTVVHPDTRRLILPFGFVQSPILASLCLYKSALGSFLEGLWETYSVVASVYVDDLILSCNDETALREAIAEIKRKADRSGFMLNPDKEAGPDRMITAFNVRLSHESLEIDPHRFAEITAAFHEADSERVREGIRGYVNSINPYQAALL